MNKNGRPRDEKGRFVSLSAMYSVKHNTVDLEKVFEEKMKFWESQGLAKSDNFFRSFKYRPEAFRIPADYYYEPDEVRTRLGEYNNYVLKMGDLTDANIIEPETILSVAKLVAAKGGSMKTMYIKNSLWRHEGLMLVPIENLNKDSDFYVPMTVKPKDTKVLFQGVVGKNKLIDLVVDTYYKLDFNKAIRTHYTFNDKLDEGCPVYICRYYSSPISIFGHDDVSAVIFKKTDFDEDGDRIILTNPEPILVLIKQDYGFLAIDLIDKNNQPCPISSLEALTSLVPNLMIPEGILRQLTRIEISNSKGTLSFLPPSAPREEFTTQPTPVGIHAMSDQPLGFGVRVNLILEVPTVITVVDELDNRVMHINVYRLGEFRAPRKNGEISEITSFSVESGQFFLATGLKDLWILIDENLDKIYFYNTHENKIVDWCLATTFDFLNLLNRFSSELLSEEVKDGLLESMNSIKRNYFSSGKVSAERNEGLTGFLDSL